MLDENLQQGLVRRHHARQLRRDGGLEGAGADADKRMLPRHIERRLPDVHAAAEEPRLDIRSGAHDAVERGGRDETDRKHERGDGKRAHQHLRTETQVAVRQRHDEERHECRQHGTPGGGEENGREGERQIQRPHPAAALLLLRETQIPGHRDRECENQPELVGVLVQAHEADGLTFSVRRDEARDRPTDSQGVVVDRRDARHARAQHVCLQEVAAALG